MEDRQSPIANRQSQIANPTSTTGCGAWPGVTRGGSRRDPGEIRNSKSEIRKKAEARSPKAEGPKGTRLGFGFRISEFIRASGFGFWSFCYAEAGTKALKEVSALCQPSVIWLTAMKMREPTGGTPYLPS